jgi:eukaryotic-like serine/threonine-protein kinase
MASNPPVDSAGNPRSSPERTPLNEETPGRYLAVREFARGGMGRILIVRDQHLGRDIALKELLRSAPLDAPTVEAGPATEHARARLVRFLQEASITARLEHPSIVPVHEVGRRANGTPYYTMKLVRGRTLDRAIAEAGSLRKRLELLNHFLDLCQALAYAHSRSVIHRDIKPTNVMIGEFGETLVLDWGIAKAVGSPKERPLGTEAGGAEGALAEARGKPLTKTGEYLGTPHYMAPEQALGRTDEVSEAADVYSLGAVLYELLTGRRCFAGGTAPQVLGKVISGERAPIQSIEPGVPVELVAICDRAMQVRPEARYPSAKELAEDIQRFLSGALVEAYEYRTMDRLRRFARRYRAILATSAVAMAVLVAMGAFAVTNIIKEQRRTEYILYGSSISLAKASVDSRHLEEAHRALEEAPAQFRNVEWGLLLALSHPELMTLRGHRGEVMYGEYSPDGTMIATCGRRDGRVLLWDARTGAPLGTITVWKDDEIEIHRMDWSSDSRLLVTATKSEETAVWDAKTGACAQKFKEFAYTPVFSPDGAMVAAATHDGRRITLFDVATGKVIREFNGPDSYQTRIAFSHDGRRLASTTSKGAIYVWDRETGPLWHRPDETHKPKATWVSFSPDDRMLLTSGSGGLAKLWDAATGKELRTLQGHGGSVGCARFTPDGARAITASADRTVRVWDVTTGEQLWMLDGFPMGVGFIGLDPSGLSFVANTLDNAAVVRPVMPVQERHTFKNREAPVNSVAFSADGKLLATGAGNGANKPDGNVVLWDTATCDRFRSIETGSRFVLSICFLPGAQRLAFAGDVGKGGIFDMQTGSRVSAFADQSARVTAVAVSPNGRMLATGNRDGLVMLRDLATGERLALMEGHTLGLCAMLFNPAGDTIATAALDGDVRLWTVPEGELIRVLPASKESVPLAFSPNGRWIATRGKGNGINLWDMKTGRLDRTFEGHASYVHCLAFTSDGRRLASGSKDSSVRIWDAETGKELLLLDQHKSRVCALAFSPDDRFLASGGEDGKTILWPIRPWLAEK